LASVLPNALGSQGECNIDGNLVSAAVGRYSRALYHLGMKTLETSASADHLPWLDGLRGTAAAWVFLAHAQILSGMRAAPLLSWGELAVDLFMMLSGFLMAHHYLLREKQEPWMSPRTWGAFWLRRFFRIAPLYYVTLFAALALGPWLGEARDAIAAVWPSTATQPARYLDHSLANVLTHVTFVFGAIPQFAFRTPLPDWSIGLEMQFYLVFPFLMLLVRRVGYLAAGIALFSVCLWLRWQFKMFFREFEMPSFLPIKLYVFVIGMWMALCRARGTMRTGLLASIAVAAAVALHQRTSESAARVVLAVVMFYLMTDGTLPAPRWLLIVIERVRSTFSGAASRFLGATSYGLYLVHLLILIPVAGALAKVPAYVSAPGEARFVICVLVAGSISLIVAWLLYRTVELGGIRSGKALILAIRGRGSVRRAV
jgi:peptidoglycan/LPS O-acetylase OafA/YrhL